ncbi:HAD-IA family hydrolase [Roseisalinus antarcticus]|uniref:Phosphatase/MT3486 n=1 Tax=Roseisalinus antarcticus TaxID=254357 RepID=A0A1Y5TL96_9RHOB|nr:HAD-IA family hydrolase [Roseisalinus antarcticus]SLN66667.1 Phosphatase/MT3486 [Roseisalinus antarcticus]
MNKTDDVRFSAILWDFDGVLNPNERQGRFRWSEEFEADFGAPLATFVDQVFGDIQPLLTGQEKIETRIAAWIAQSGVDATPEQVVEYWLSRDFHPDRRLIELSADAAKRGIRQAILTNADLRRGAWIESRLPDMPHMERLFVSSSIGHAKPDPRAYAAAVEGLGLEPNKILFVDDVTANVNAAAKLGFRTFRYSRLSYDALRSRLPRSV